MKQETLNERKKEISPKSDTLLHYKNQTHCFEKRDWLRPVLRLLLVDFGGTKSFVRPSIVRLYFFGPHLPRPTYTFPDQFIGKKGSQPKPFPNISKFGFSE